MTLNELLTTTEMQNKVVKIGFEGASNFIYCDAVTSKTLEELDRIEQDSVANAKMNLKQASEFLSDLRKMGLKKFIANERKKIEKANEKRAAEGLGLIRIPSQKRFESMYNERMAVYERSITRCEFTLSQEHPIIEAGITDTYKSIDTPDTVIVICDGYISGDYWTQDEYLNGYKRPRRGGNRKAI